MRETLNALFAGFVLSVTASSQTVGRGTGTLQPQPPVFRQPVSPEALSDGRVTFRLMAPTAKEIVVNGDWPNGRNIAMTKDEKGLWSVTVGPLEPEVRTYTFSVDGVSMIDPQNMSVKRNNGRLSSNLVIPGPEARYYEFRNVPHGALSLQWYSSPTLNLQRRTYIYTPPGYQLSADRYPVLYLLHGGGSDELTWEMNLRASEILDNLIAEGKAEPMIVVMPNEMAFQNAAPDITGHFVEDRLREGFVATGTANAKDLIPFIDKAYRTKADRENRAVAGFSYGGAESWYLTFNHLDMIASLGSFSCGCDAPPDSSVALPPPANGAPPPGAGRGQVPRNTIDPVKWAAYFPQLTADANSKLKLFYVSIGTNDFLWPVHTVIKGILAERGIKYTLLEMPGYGHEGTLWRKNLVEFAQKIFK